MSKAAIRRRRTEAVGKRNNYLDKIDTPNKSKGRSQKGCFGGTYSQFDKLYGTRPIYAKVVKEAETKEAANV